MEANKRRRSRTKETRNNPLPWTFEWSVERREDETEVDAAVAAGAEEDVTAAEEDVTAAVVGAKVAVAVAEDVMEAEEAVAVVEEEEEVAVVAADSTLPLTFPRSKPEDK